MNALKKIFFRPPFIGLLGFIVVLIVQALGHTVMILMENIFGEEYVYQSATVMGLFGAVLT
jgi:predicted cobalt transporter CbtA